MTERLTSTRFEEVFSLPAKAATEYFKGRLLAVNSDGRATAAAALAGLIVVGLIHSTVDNSAGAHGDVVVPYRLGTFLMDNDGVSPLTQAHVGRPCFIKDDITVTSDPGENNVFAGIFRGFHNNGSGVWVDTRLLPVWSSFYENNADSNFRFSADPDSGAPIFQLWNQDQDTWQTVQLAGAAGLERLVIES
jgi:hypothetical protein